MLGAGTPYNAGMAGSVRERLTHLQRRMRAAERRFGRPPGSARLLAVGKAQPPAAVRAAAGLGVADFGENRLQPALAKMAALSDLDLTWHFIGSIQRRKAREIARRFDWVHSLDRLEVAERLDRARPPERAPLPVCVQVNLSGEPGKSGIERGRLLEFLAELRRFPRLRPRGLMTLPAPEREFAAQRRAFAQLGDCARRARAAGFALDTLSMGMSGDFEAAIAEGATWVRIGAALFGPRPAAAAHG